MRRFLAITLGAASVASGAYAADVGVSIQFSQPGVFGRIDIGQYPQPRVIIAEPVVVEPPPPAMPPPEPVYLWVPHEHRQDWKRHCREYHACGHPVYFVDHDWYRDHVARGAEGRRDEERHRGRGRSEEEHGRHKGHDGRDDEDRDRGRD